MLGLIAIAGRHLIQNGRGEFGDQRDQVENARTIAGPQTQQGSVSTLLGLSPVSGETEKFLDDALAAVRRGDFDRAKSLLEQYLSHPGIRQVEEARSLQDEIDLALSTVNADELARGLKDEQLKTYAQLGVESLVKSSLRTPELRPFYRRTLLQAFLRERDRRQPLLNGDALVQAHRPVAPAQPAVEAADPPEDDAKPPPPQTSSLLGSDDDGTDAPARIEDAKLKRALPDGVSPSGSTTLDAVLAKPTAFVGRTLVLDGLYKIGTRLSKVDDPDGNPLGWSLPVGSSDSRVIGSGDTKVEGKDAYLVLESGLAPLLERVFNKLKFNATTKPTYKCILTVTVREMIVKNARTAVVEIAGLEILGTCDFLQVARRRYEKAFQTVQISPQGASWPTAMEPRGSNGWAARRNSFSRSGARSATCNERSLPSAIRRSSPEFSRANCPRLSTWPFSPRCNTAGCSRP